MDTEEKKKSQIRNASTTNPATTIMIPFLYASSIFLCLRLTDCIVPLLSEITNFPKFAAETDMPRCCRKITRTDFLRQIEHPNFHLIQTLGIHRKGMLVVYIGIIVTDAHGLVFKDIFHGDGVQHQLFIVFFRLER